MHAMQMVPFMAMPPHMGLQPNSQGVPIMEVVSPMGTHTVPPQMHHAAHGALGPRVGLRGGTPMRPLPLQTRRGCP